MSPLAVFTINKYLKIVDTYWYDILLRLSASRCLHHAFCFYLTCIRNYKVLDPLI